MSKPNVIRIKTIIVILSFISSSILKAQPNCQWDKGYGGANEDFGIATTVDPFGNVYSIGHFNSPSITFGTITLPNVDIFGTTSDVFIVKSDSCGNVMWAKKAGDQDYDDRGAAITTDKDGNVYATGSYYSYYIKFGADSLANTGTGWSTYIVKYSPSGNQLWSKGLDATGSVYPTDITVDKNGDLFMAGYYLSDTVKFDAIKLIGSSSYSSFIAKYNSSNGNTVWAKNAEYSGNRLYSITADTIGGIFAAGSFNDSIKIENIVLQGDPNLNAYFVKYNTSGNVIWAKSAGYNYNDEATGITTDKIGNIYLCGYFQSDSISFGNNIKLTLPSPTVNGNGFIVKFNSTGNALWAKRTGGFSQDYIGAVTTNAAGDVFIGGDFRSSSISLDGVTLNNITGTNTTYDIFMAKYNTNGQLKWAKKAGGAGNDYIECLAIGSNGIPYVIGEYASASISFPLQTLTNGGTDDIYITNEMNRIEMSIPQLCEVTVDSVSLNNMIYWDKTPYTGIERFIVYREIATNDYKPIASIHVDSLSLFVDTVRAKYFPNTGDPNVGTYRYKLQIVDTVGNYSLLSPFHNTIYIVNNGSGQFSWNPSYTIESSANPVSNYVLMRDDNSTGSWAIVGSVTGSQNTIADPSYSGYSNGRWRIETTWSITCTPTRASINTTRSNIKNASATNSISKMALNNEITVYPNPATETVTIQYPIGYNKYQLQLFDALGQLVYSEPLVSDQAYNGILTKQINVGTFRKGIYIINVQTENGNTFKRLAIQ